MNNKMAVIEENWNYSVDNLKIEGSKEFELRVGGFRDAIINSKGFKLKNYNYNEISPNHDEELKVLVEINKQLRNEIDQKLEEVSLQKNKYEHYKQDQKLLSQEIKDTHEAFLMAKKYYKKYLKMYYTIESENNDHQTIYIQFFTEAKKESENCSVRLQRNKKTEHCALIETNPKVKILDDLKKTLQETNDIPSVLCSIRQSFLKMKKNKKS